MLLECAPAPEGDDGEEGGDGPASSGVGGAADADFGVDESEEVGGDEGEEEHCEDDGFEDEDEGAGVPAGVEGEEGTDAVVVGPVEEDVAEEGDEGEGVEEGPANGGDAFSWQSGGIATGAPAVDEPDGTDYDGCFEGKADEGVGPAAMVLEGSDGTVDGPEDVEVGDLSGDDHGDGGVGGFAVAAGAG